MPGNPIANVTFKTYAYISQVQGLLFLSDLKVGHYMKVRLIDITLKKNKTIACRFLLALCSFHKSLLRLLLVLSIS